MRKTAITLVLLLMVGGAAAQNDERDARRLLRLVNQEREETGAPPLAWDERLAQAALPHARLMAEHGELSHQFSGEPNLRARIAATGLRFNDDAENVAYADSVDEAHANLMRSPGHRANILNPRTNAIGIVALRKGERLYIVEDFALKLPELSDEEVVQRVLAEFNRQRRAARLPEVSLAGDLHGAACEMARLDHVDTSPIHALKATSYVGFTTFAPDELPSTLKERVHGSFSAIAIGACYAKSPNYPSGVTWV
ncbi:MAG TPA: CAP domain-containing protein, partial [Terriglobales bacterium]|nr:CAP domain-containing protein [Terriglobales bacterium]